MHANPVQAQPIHMTVNPAWTVPVSLQPDMARRGKAVLTRVAAGSVIPLGKTIIYALVLLTRFDHGRIFVKANPYIFGQEREPLHDPHALRMPAPSGT
jgi:hypothetical protein